MFEIIGFFFIQVALLIIGVVIGAVLLTAVFLLTRRVASSRQKRTAVVTAFVFPIFALFYIEAGLLVYEWIEFSRGGDSAIFGGFIHTPLVNGFRLKFWNESPNSDGQLESSEGQLMLTEGIKGIQVSGDYLFVHAEPRNQQPGQGQPTVTINHGIEPLVRSPQDQYLEIDTRTSAVIEHSSLEELRFAALERGDSLHLISLDQAYNERFPAASLGWFHVILFTPLLITSVWLLWKLRQLRRLSYQRAIRD